MGRRNTQARDLQALQLKQDGLTFDEIAERLHFANRSSAWKAVQRAIKLTDVAATRDEHRAVELARLDEMTSALAPKIKQGDLAAMDRALAIAKHRARLLELFSSVNAPHRRVATGAEDDGAVGGAQVINMAEAAAAIREAVAGGQGS